MKNNTILKLAVTGMVAAGMMMSTTGVVRAQEVDARKAIQQGRIRDGVKNGSLTPSETKELERKEAGVNRQTRRERRQNGGYLTPKEKAQVNRRQNRVSRDIYRQKHDGDK